MVLSKYHNFPKGGAILTVDDGCWQVNDQNVIAIANKHQILVVFFAITAAIDRLVIAGITGSRLITEIHYTIF